MKKFRGFNDTEGKTGNPTRDETLDGDLWKLPRSYHNAGL